ncbi:MAG: alpha/beta hydrolase [Mycobacteriales bacterium]
MVPGLLCDDALYRPQREALSGLTEVRIPDVSGPAGIAAMAESVLAGSPPAFALLGLSMGGYVALEVMRQAPERVLALALLDTSARPDTPEQSANRRALIAAAGRDGVRAAVDLLWPKEVAPSRVDDQALRAVLDAMADRLGVEAFVRQQEAIMARADSRPDLSQISCPTLVLCGRDDAICPLDGHEEMTDRIAGATLEVLDDCGHLSTLERPEQVNAALRRWLATLS